MKTSAFALRSGWFLLAVCCLVTPVTAQIGDGLPVPTGGGASHEAMIVDNSTIVLEEVMAIPAKAIPASMLADAEGIAIVPRMIKGGFVIGVKHGRGVIVIRNEQRQWTPPKFITITGGSVGWQAGLQATDVVLVFKSKRSIQGLTSGKFTLGADASAAAGPVGRDASIGTDARLQAEIYSYSRARGLFAGAALDGSVIQMDDAADWRYYGNGPGSVAVPGEVKPLPPSATKLLQIVAMYTNPKVGQTVATPVATTATKAPDLQTQLVEASRRLEKVLDKSWQAYLALPVELYEGTGAADLATMQKLETKFASVAADTQYRALNTRSEFQVTYSLLKAYIQQLSSGNLQALPPPPAPSN